MKSGVGEFHIVHLRNCGSHYTVLTGVNENFPAFSAFFFRFGNVFGTINCPQKRVQVIATFLKICGVKHTSIRV